MSCVEGGKGIVGTGVGGSGREVEKVGAGSEDAFGVPFW
jgi:hypothetical protein